MASSSSSVLFQIITLSGDLTQTGWSVAIHLCLTLLSTESTFSQMFDKAHMLEKSSMTHLLSSQLNFKQWLLLCQYLDSITMFMLLKGNQQKVIKSTGFFFFCLFFKSTENYVYYICWHDMNRVQMVNIFNLLNWVFTLEISSFIMKQSNLYESYQI